MEYGYTGEWEDQNDLVYLWARYYDPAQQLVIVQQSGSNQQTRLHLGDTLTRGDVLPTVERPLSSFFAEA
jgi:hypothetical protein